MSEITRNPLCWPDSIPRTAPHNRGTPRFGERSLAASAEFVLAEINRLNNRWHDHKDASVIISSNLVYKANGVPYSQQEAAAGDSGVAVYFTLRINRNGKIIERPIVMSCDKWRKCSDNLYAIGKDIEAQRARERWGCTNYEQAFRGYMAIPEHCGGESWWVLLKIKPDAPREAVVDSYRVLAKAAHPDAGGSAEAFVRLTEAYNQAMAQFG